MTTNTSQPAYAGLLTKRVLIGAAIALVMITVFLIMGGPGKPEEWGTWWKVRPLVIVTFAGAVGGLFYHLMERFRGPGGWKKILVNVLCLLVYIVGLWFGSVLGFVGTWWH